MICTCNRDHVNDDEHAPTCAVVLPAELAQLRADNKVLAREVEAIRAKENAKHSPGCGPGVRLISDDIPLIDEIRKARAATDASGALERAGRKRRQSS